MTRTSILPEGCTAYGVQWCDTRLQCTVLVVLGGVRLWAEWYSVDLVIHPRVVRHDCLYACVSLHSTVNSREERAVFCIDGPCTTRRVRVPVFASIRSSSKQGLLAILPCCCVLVVRHTTSSVLAVSTVYQPQTARSLCGSRYTSERDLLALFNLF